MRRHVITQQAALFKRAFFAGLQAAAALQPVLRGAEGERDRLGPSGRGEDRGHCAAAATRRDRACGGGGTSGWKRALSSGTHCVDATSAGRQALPAGSPAVQLAAKEHGERTAV